MFTFISIMAVGVLIGYPLRHKSQIRKITPLIHIVVCLLLFLLGLSIGLNRLIIDNLGYFCGQAAVISSLSILGSMMASLAVYRIFSEERGQTVKSSLVTLAFFLFGCVAGVSYAVDFDVHQTSVYVLYVLMLLLGINLGSNRNLRQFVLSLNFRTLLVPFATVSGTLLFSAIGGFLLSRWSIFDCMAVGSGFSYYSVSSILITQIKSPSIGVQLATELGTIALLSNIFREMTALIGAPLFRKYFGYLAPISAAGIGSSDISLAAIARCSGPEAVPVAIVHGILINISMPFFVSFFCKL